MEGNFSTDQCGQGWLQDDSRHTTPAVQETRVQSLSQVDPLEQGLATHSSTRAWRISRTEEPGRLQSTGSQRVGHD